MRLVRAASIALLAMALVGCATEPPAGFDARASLERARVVAERFVPYGQAPLSWTAPDGNVRVTLDEAVVATGPLLYLGRLDYAVAFAGRDEPPLRCRWSTSSAALLECDGSRHDVRLQLGPGCQLPSDLADASCRRATLDVGARRLHLHEGRVRRLGAPSGQLAIVDERGTLVAAADVVAKAGIEAWLPDVQAAPVEREVALLVFVAYHQWRHRTSAD